MTGIALDYKVSTYDIKRMNNLTGDEILHLKEIKIPKTEKNQQIK